MSDKAFDAIAKWCGAIVFVALTALVVGFVAHAFLYALEHWTP